MAKEIRVVERGGLHELSGQLEPSRLYNEDLAPTTLSQRTWGTWNIAALWVGMSVCIPTYMLASFMIKDGLLWWEAMLLIMGGNLIVLVPMIINAHAGTKYGVPFPVYLRTAFGFFGANIPALARAAVACGWFGIQTWIGGKAIGDVLLLVAPSLDVISPQPLLGMIAPAFEVSNTATILGITPLYWVSFLLFWAINMWIVWHGVESIKWMESLAAPFLLLIGLALFGWAVKVGLDHGGFSKLLEVAPVNVKNPPTALKYFGWLTGMVGYWATLSLNIPDFTRFAKSQRAQITGQIIGLPTTMVMFSFIGVIVTSATILVFGQAIWDPVELVSRLSSGTGGKLLGIVALLALAVATLSTNIAANVVSPANDISNLAPDKISFRKAGMITGVVGIVILPWKLLSVYQGWLITYSGLLGAVGGVIICHYLVLDKQTIWLKELYTRPSRYNYQRGFNWYAILALFVGISVPLLGQIWPSLVVLFKGGWFFSFLTAFIVYYGLMTALHPKNTERRTI